MRDPDCFDRAGVKHGRWLCACKARVDFKNASARAEHFLVCPVVDERVMAAVERMDPTELEQIAAQLTHANNQD